MLTSLQLKDVLIQGKILKEAEFEKIAADAAAKKANLEEHIIAKRVISEDLLYGAAANYFHIPFINLKNITIDQNAFMMIPETVATTHNVIAFEKTETALKVATLDPKNLETIEFLKKKTGLTIEVSLTTPSALKETFKRYHKALGAEVGTLTKSPNGEQRIVSGEDIPIIKLVDTILEHAMLEGASDIHIEPSEKELTVRFRIDGMLKPMMTLPNSVQAGVVARVKILANLKIDEHRLPQDGRFKIATNEYKFSFRVSVIPVFDGEKIVLRLLPETTKILSLEYLGFEKGQLERVKRNIQKPHGMILVTGPTGSGKTTTLYTLLNMLNHPGVNITTIEDPIEYRMPGVNQSQVNPKIGFTFANGLRSFLRQDPNIIMVGEIRDTETAEIAVHASLTGHLVLSTLHTNDAITTVHRLLDMGVPPFLLASTLALIVAQRLVRKICPQCIESYQLDEKMIQEMERTFNIPEMLATLSSQKIIMPQQTLGSLLFYRGKGCKHCNQEGYRGRMGLYEVLEVTKSMSELVLKRATREELETQAQKDGMMTLLHDGFIKAKNGITTIQEIIRVTKE